MIRSASLGSRLSLPFRFVLSQGRTALNAIDSFRDSGLPELVVGVRMAAARRKLESRYLLVSHIPTYRDADGLLVDRLWALDLQKHAVYLQNLTLAAPLKNVVAPPGCEKIAPVISFIP